MLSVRLDPDLERLLERDVDDLARYNILRYLHDHPQAGGDVDFFSEELGLRSPELVGDALDALVRAGLVARAPSDRADSGSYCLSVDPRSRWLVDKLYRLSSTGLYGEIVDRLAARSLHRARRVQASSRCGHRADHKMG